jgi:hypothetical protein
MVISMERLFAATPVAGKDTVLSGKTNHTGNVMGI